MITDELVKKAIAGDEEAQLKLFELCKPQREQVIKKRIRKYNEEHAERTLERDDFEGNAWLAFKKALYYWDPYAENRIQFRYFFYLILDGALNDSVRKEGLTVSIGSTDYYQHKKYVNRDSVDEMDLHVIQTEDNFRSRLFYRIPFEIEQVLRKYAMLKRKRRDKNFLNAVKVLREHYTDEEVREILTNYNIV